MPNLHYRTAEFHHLCGQSRHGDKIGAPPDAPAAIVRFDSLDMFSANELDEAVSGEVGGNVIYD